MKYIFGLLFEYEYYKNPANIKIFFNDHLIDDIDLTENINIRNIPFDPSWLPIDASIRRSKTWDGLKFLEIPEKVFVYTLDETIIQNSIKIKVTNNNSNYTNGFMTKWSSFEFHGIFLMPACYLNYKAYDMDVCNNDIDNLQNEIKSHKDIRPNSGHNLICLP